MGTPFGPKYVPYTYMDPLGYGLRFRVLGSREACIGRSPSLFTGSSSRGQASSGFGGVGV